MIPTNPAGVDLSYLPNINWYDCASVISKDDLKEEIYDMKY